MIKLLPVISHQPEIKTTLKNFYCSLKSTQEMISQVMSLWFDQIWMFTSPKRWFFGGVAGCLFLHIKELMSTEKWQKCSRQGWNPSISGLGFWCLDQSLGSPSWWKWRFDDRSWSMLHLKKKKQIMINGCIGLSLSQWQWWKWLFFSWSQSMLLQKPNKLGFDASI